MNKNGLLANMPLTCEDNGDTGFALRAEGLYSWRASLYVSASKPAAWRSAMNEKPAMQLPTQVREMAEKTVEQAEKAFGTFMQAAHALPSNGSDLPKKLISLTEQNMKAAFDHAKALINATDMAEIMRLQTEYVQKQFAAATDQMKQLGGSINDSAKSFSSKS